MDIRFPNAAKFDAAVLPEFVKVASDMRKAQEDGRVVLHRATLKSLIQTHSLHVLGGDTILDMVVTLTFGESMEVDGRGGPLVNGVVVWVEGRLIAAGYADWFATAAPAATVRKVRGGSNRAKYADLGLA
jgi:hypothetical protein